MHSRITGFHEDIGPQEDANAQWVAELECGHGQHVRHRPPWEIRPWVQTETARLAMIGKTLDCLICNAPFTGTPRG
jgi:hypothetical protein